MRTSFALLAALALVPATAFADDSKPAPDSNVEKVPYVAPQSVAYEGGKIPMGSFIEKRPNYVFVATGVSILGAAYAASLVTAVAMCGPGMDCSRGSGWLYLPVVGPFVTAAMAPTTGGQALAAFNGGVQVIGASLAIAGFIAPKKFVVWQDEKKTATLDVAPSAGGFSFTLTH
jgi:hypothetical protein